MIKSVILAAGRGTRMRELTHAVPKPMLRVHGKPILEHILRRLMAAGSEQFCIITGWHAEVIEDYFGDGKAFDTRITYARQTVQDGTGKAPELAREFVGSDNFILTYGDILVRQDTYQKMICRFLEAEFSGLLTVLHGADVSKGALVLLDPDRCLRLLVEKPGPDRLDQLRREGRLLPGDQIWYNAGVYLFRPELFEFTARLTKSPRGEYELTDAIGAMQAAGRRIAAVEIVDSWVDVRDPEMLAALEREWERGA
ncbi:MAG: sugar phosphate nucleotidyltransferase [Candidatus Omnitrophica bacterium]|nr:sugar phosphate nucleotidyltransferase [Candidatus Omnitrophota bacterium]